MPDPRIECERAQLALVEGLQEGWIAAHVAACAECRFFSELSSELSGADRVHTGVAESDLGAAFEGLLDQAAALQRPLARYRLVERLGRGGQGVVYRALDTETRETIALKVVRSRADRAGNAVTEVALAHLVPHPNVCRVYHTERHGDVRLIVMELVEGRRLDEAAAELSAKERLRLFRQVCEAVSAAHEADVLHLDLKPANILVRASGSPVVTDFGLAARTSEAATGSRQAGTPGYMAPEQVEGGPVGRRTDVYALGIILRELFPSGHRNLEQIINRAAAKSPERRYAAIGDLLHDLDQPARLRRRAGRFVAGLTLLAPLGLSLIPLWEAKPPKGDVLVLGGQGADGRWHASTEVFDVRSGAWQTLDPVPDPERSVPRTCEMRAVRSGDDVLVLGGGDASGCRDGSATTNRVRVYSLATRRWSVPECQAPCIEHEGSTFWLDRTERTWFRRWKRGACRPEGPCMLYGRNQFAAVPLLNDDVFVYAGCAGQCAGPNELDQTEYPTREWPVSLARTAEIYRLATRTWAPLLPSLLTRPRPNAVVIGDQVLVCGRGSMFDKTEEQGTCEVFSRFATEDAWRPAGRMPETATPALLPLGVDVVLGLQPGYAWLWRNKDQWGNPEEWRWDQSFFKPLPLPIGGPGSGTLTRLGDGRVLLVGGMAADHIVPTAQVFTLGPGGEGGTWTEVAPMRRARRDHAAVALEDGRILVVGGCGPEPLASAEVYDPASDQWAEVRPMSSARCAPQAVSVW